LTVENHIVLKKWEDVASERDTEHALWFGAILKGQEARH